MIIAWSLMFHIQKDVELCKFIIKFSFLLVFDTLAREVAAVTAKRFPSSLSGRESYFETALEMCPLDPNANSAVVPGLVFHL